MSDDATAGVYGNNVYVVVGDKVSLFSRPVNSWVQQEATQLEIIGNQVVQDITGSEDITFEQVQSLSAASGRTAAKKLLS